MWAKLATCSEQELKWSGEEPFSLLSCVWVGRAGGEPAWGRGARGMGDREAGSVLWWWLVSEARGPGCTAAGAGRLLARTPAGPPSEDVGIHPAATALATGGRRGPQLHVAGSTRSPVSHARKRVTLQ